MIVNEPGLEAARSHIRARRPRSWDDEASRPVILTIIGTRPEAIKLAPVIRELSGRADVRSIVCVTAQHRGLVDDVLAWFGVRPDHDLDVMQPGQSLTDVAARVMERIDPVLATEQPDWVLIQGDTSSVVAAALAAFHRRIPVAHVEAGLRSHSLSDPFPEEANRRIASLLTALHLAPTEVARGNLLAEGIAAGSIVVTGNPVIDALRIVLREAHVKTSRPRRTVPLILATIHRRESFGPPLEAICLALRRIALEREVRIVIPVHPNPSVEATIARILGEVPAVELVPPLNYPELVRLLTESHFVMTDSGGLQEEAPALGKPVLVLRETTERPEAIEAGAAVLVGRDPERIAAAAFEFLDGGQRYRQMAVPRPIYGDGHAAGRIVNAILAIGRPLPESPVAADSASRAAVTAP